MALGLITLTLLISPLRLAAVVPATVGLWLATSHKGFDIYVDRDGAGAAVRGSDRRLVLVGRVPAFVAEQWLRADGDGRKSDDPSLQTGVRCDPLGCVVTTQDSRSIAVVRDRRAFTEDCGRAAFVATRLQAPPTCKPAVLLDRVFFAAHGATAIRLTGMGPDIVTTRRPNETPPWLQRAGLVRAERLMPRYSPDAARRAALDVDGAEPPRPLQ
jgi:competence protein ComEC